jgi:hypothetical protein
MMLRNTMTESISEKSTAFLLICIFAAAHNGGFAELSVPDGDLSISVFPYTDWKDGIQDAERHEEGCEWV